MKYQTESSFYRDSTCSMGRNATAFRACAECTHFCRSGHSRKRDQSTPVYRFVKVLIGGDDWDKMLLLPPAFAPTVEDLVGKETEIENAVGEKWTVTLSSYHNGRIGFLKGWEDFVMDHRLDAGDFLVFNYIEGSHFTVHIYGRTLCEKNRNGSFGRKHQKGNVSAQLKPCDRKDSGVKGRLLQSRFIASGSKSGPSVPRGVFKSSSAHKPQHYRGDHSMWNKSGKRSYFEEHEGRLPSRNREGIDGGMLASNLLHIDKRSQAKSDKYRVETEHLKSNRIPKVNDASMFRKDHAYMGSIGEGQEDCTRTEKIMSKTFPKATHVSMAEKDSAYMGSVTEGKGDRIRTENVKSRTFTKATQVSVTEKDRPLMFRDDSTHKCESKTNVSHSSGIHFKLPGEEPSRKGNDGSSACEYEGAVFPNCGHKRTGDLKKNVIDELPESSEPGHYYAKRKRGNDQNSPCTDEVTVFPSFGHLYTGDPKNTVINELPERSEPRNYHANRKIGSYSVCSSANLNSLPRGMTTLKQVKAEPCDSYSSELGIVTCPAVTSGERLELPDKLPALRYLKRGGKAIFLLDQKSAMWPALYEERSGVQVLICNWEKFNPDNEIATGDKYVLTVEDAVQFIYRINVIRPVPSN